jgi:hypothetical protein
MSRCASSSQAMAVCVSGRRQFSPHHAGVAECPNQSKRVLCFGLLPPGAITDELRRQGQDCAKSSHKVILRGSRGGRMEAPAESAVGVLVNSSQWNTDAKQVCGRPKQQQGVLHWHCRSDGCWHTTCENISTGSRDCWRVCIESSCRLGLAPMQIHMLTRCAM